MDISETTYRPWETKTIDKFTVEELIHWVHWYAKGRKGPVTFNPDVIVHNVLLWERTRAEKLSQTDRQDSGPAA